MWRGAMGNWKEKVSYLLLRGELACASHRGFTMSRVLISGHIADSLTKAEESRDLFQLGRAVLANSDRAGKA